MSDAESERSRADDMDDLDGAPTILAHALRVGKLLGGRYRMDEKIGAGGMGQVWRAQDAELDMPVAIKVLPPVLAGDEESIAGLKREARIALRLSHPSICRLYTFHSDGSVKFLVMELIAGQTLKRLLAGRAEERMGWEELEPIARQIASALDCAHGLTPPVLHRDIKPGNIMVQADGVAKLVDFGIARELHASLTRVTGRADTSGTLLYMSPEQFRGDALDARSDVYSLCAVLYEALAGRPLVNAGGSAAWQILDRPFAPPPGVPEEARRLLAAGLAKDPSDRPASAGALFASSPEAAGAPSPGASPIARLRQVQQQEIIDALAPLRSGPSRA